MSLITPLLRAPLSAKFGLLVIVAYLVLSRVLPLVLNSRMQKKADKAQAAEGKEDDEHCSHRHPSGDHRHDLVDAWHDSLLDDGL